MASSPSRGLRVRRIIALAVGGLLTTHPARAQAASPAPKIVLDAKTASRLALSQIRPEYPAIAKQNYIQGRVRVQIEVTRDGRVRRAHVIQGHAFLAVAALEAVRRWRYRPYMTRSGPGEFVTLAEMKFALRTKKIESVPREAEQDLKRQIRPPQVVEKPPSQTGSDSVRMRLLLNEKGQILDSQPVAGLPSEFEASRLNVEHWTFRPARWGSMPVPWYLDVDVPVKEYHREAGEPGGP